METSETNDAAFGQYLKRLIIWSIDAFANMAAIVSRTKAANANTKEKADVAERLIPITYKGIGRDNLFTLTATVVFKNALFRTDIKIAPYEMDVFDPELGAPEHFTIGQMKLTNEDLLLEELNVPIDPPPGEFDTP